MTELTITGGDGAAERTGYWTVTGPQSPNDVYALIERTRVLLDDGGERFVFAWYLHHRSAPNYRRTPMTHMMQIASGQAETVDEALKQLQDEWPTHLNDA